MKYHKIQFISEQIYFLTRSKNDQFLLKKMFPVFIVKSPIKSLETLFLIGPDVLKLVQLIGGLQSGSILILSFQKNAIEII